MKFIPFRDLPALIGGLGAFLTFLRFSEWFETARAINFPIPSYFSLTDGIARALASFLLVGLLIWLNVNRIYKRNSRVEWAVGGTLLSYFLPMVPILYMTPTAFFDTGLIMNLSVNGIIASTSSLFYKRLSDFKDKKFPVDSQKLGDYLKLEHEECSSLIRDLNWLFVFITAGLVYSQYLLYWQDLIKYGGGLSNPLIWRTFLVLLLYTLWVDASYVIGIMRPLFQYRTEIKNKILSS